MSDQLDKVTSFLHEVNKLCRDFCPGINYHFIFKRPALIPVLSLPNILVHPHGPTAILTDPSFLAPLHITGVSHPTGHQTVYVSTWTELRDKLFTCLEKWAKMAGCLHKLQHLYSLPDFLCLD
ncbi:zinc-binding matrix protein [Turtle fraservirus 1]|uniref:zinc-binding matrix protein n=1 Tax=Turtle fraservirus 1 TaxID=2912878 RepID=UPI002483D1C3|nr:zinc-binding matrix protein [Turtle fraservirus 1]UJT32111.1 zinc-binding matrix protein [Turtle fraservirus 1]UKB93129.1 zinc-binding matrix protein [Turtle fraservirus 1]